MQWELFSGHNIHHTSTESLCLSRIFYVGFLNGPLVGSLAILISLSYSYEEALLTFRSCFFLALRMSSMTVSGPLNFAIVSSLPVYFCLIQKMVLWRLTQSSAGTPAMSVFWALWGFKHLGPHHSVTTKWGHSVSADMLMDSPLLCHTWD